MNSTMIQDKRVADLLSRVRDDISSLRHDVAHLAQYTGRHTLPEAVRDGRDYARDRIERVGEVAREHPAGVSLGGVLLLGAMAAGAWMLVKGDGCCEASARRRAD